MTKKPSLIIALCLLTNILTGQDSNHENKIDSIGQKQGFWKINLPYPQRNTFCTYEGIFFNDKYVGVWQKKFQGKETVEIEIFYDTLELDAERLLFYSNGSKKGGGKISLRPFNDTIFILGAGDDLKPHFVTKTIMKHGSWKYYYLNGVLESEGAYQDDKQVGIWNYYDNKGSLLKRRQYNK